jgi:hypothetical protein
MCRAPRWACAATRRCCVAATCHASRTRLKALSGHRAARPNSTPRARPTVPRLPCHRRRPTAPRPASRAPLPPRPPRARRRRLDRLLADRTAVPTEASPIDAAPSSTVLAPVSRRSSAISHTPVPCRRALRRRAPRAHAHAVRCAGRLGWAARAALAEPKLGRAQGPCQRCEHGPRPRYATGPSVISAE